MDEQTPTDDVTPERLQEAIDTILGQFGYPDRLTVTHHSVPGRSKRSEFRVERADGTDHVLTIEHRSGNEQVDIVTEASESSRSTDPNN